MSFRRLQKQRGLHPNINNVLLWTGPCNTPGYSICTVLALGSPIYCTVDTCQETLVPSEEHHTFEMIYFI